MEKRGHIIKSSYSTNKKGQNVHPSCLSNMSSQMHTSLESIPNESLSSESEDYHTINKYESEERANLVLERDALRAFKNKDEASFTKILSKTECVKNRDKGVILATSAGWIEAVDKLLIRKPSSWVYNNDLRYGSDVLVGYYFENVVQKGASESFDKRWMIRKALIQTIKHKRYDIFTLLLTAVDVDFCDDIQDSYNYQSYWHTGRHQKHENQDNPLYHIFEYCTETHEIRQFLRPLLEKINSKTPYRLLLDSLGHLSRSGDTEMISEIFSKALPRLENETYNLESILRDAIKDGMDEVVKCAIEHLDKFFPGYNNPENILLAVISKRLSIIQWLVQNRHNSYTLKEYGDYDAKELKNFLKKANAQELYDQIIRSN